MEDDTFGDIPISLPSQKTSISRKTQSNFGTDIDIMKRDIIDKDRQIDILTKKISSLNETCQDIRNLILYIEDSTDSQLFTKEQRDKLDGMTPHESIDVLKKALRTLIDLHKELPQRYEEDFSQKVQNIANEIDRSNNVINALRARHSDLIHQNTVLDRMIYMADTERQSLKYLSEHLNEEVVADDMNVQIYAAQAKDHCMKMRKAIQEIHKQTKELEAKNADIEAQINAPFTKRMRDNMKDDIELSNEINDLQRQLEREYNAHTLAQEELDHTLAEIDRANVVQMKFKRSHTKAEKTNAEKVNKDLRTFIHHQREDYAWKIKNQIKRNKELERQKVDLEEEESMLRPYLQIVEKKLAAQMQKLPTLATLQHRDEPLSIQKRNKTAKNKKREPDDAEMRNMKRTISKIKAQRRRPQTTMT